MPQEGPVEVYQQICIGYYLSASIQLTCVSIYIYPVRAYIEINNQKFLHFKVSRGDEVRISKISGNRGHLYSIRGLYLA